MRAFLIFLVVSTLGYSQSIERQVIGSTGSTLTDGSTVSLDFTVGELAVTTITDGATTLTQGFHQGELQLAINLSAIVYLQGAALNPNTGEEMLMRDDLRVAGIIPTISPYTDALTCDASVFTTTGANAIVDWIWVELRDANDATIVVEGQSALLQKDGDVVSIDGVSPLSFNQSPANYYVVINHRNHLGIMTLNTLALTDTVTPIDFTDANNQITYGTNAQTTFGVPTNTVAMWAGDVNGDKEIKQQGSLNDSNAIKDIIVGDSGNSSNNNLYTFDGYSTGDVNLDGTIKYQGSGNDSSIVKDIIVSNPLNTGNSNLYIILQQIPE